MDLNNEHLEKSWDEVRAAELTEIVKRREKAELTAGPDAPDANLTGLALSGGGIRSASFNLGVLQALVESGFFRYVDFLSTVSGGGYIGSFLSSLAYRQHLERKHANGTAPPGYTLPPIGQKADGSAAEDTKSLGKNSNFLNDKLEFVSRYLIGWFLNFFTLFSGLVVVSTVLALLWLLLDMPVVVDLLIYFSRGYILEWNRPFLPAVILFLIWICVWSKSYFTKGSVATARHSGKFLIAAAGGLVVGAAIWLGTSNMNFTNVRSPSYNPNAQSYFNAHQDWIWAIAVIWLMTVLPFLRPLDLLKSGTDTTSPWKGWVFHIAGYSLLIGIPFATTYLIGQHNISGVGHQWSREVVSSDIVDWQKLWKQIRLEREAFKKNNGPLTPGILLLENMEKKEPLHQTQKWLKIIHDDRDLFQLQHNKTAFEWPPEYYARINTKNEITELVSEALNQQITDSQDYLKGSESELRKTIEMLLEQLEELAKDFPWIKDMLIKAFGDKPDVTYEIVKDYISASGNSIPMEWKKTISLQTGKLKPAEKNKLEQFIKAVDTLQYRQEIRKRLKKIIDLPTKEELRSLQVAVQLNRIVELKEDPEAQKEARRLADILDEYDFYHQKVDDAGKPKNPDEKAEAKIQADVAGQWMEKVYPKTGAGHLLMRLYYKDYLRPIQLANRPTVIKQDQITRLWILLISGGIFLFFGGVINFNATSLHGFYRRRIQRVFLVRHFNPGDEDEHREIALKEMTNTEEGYPYHILTGCVEIDTGKRGDPVTRVAFQFSKLYCGGREIDFCKTGAYRQAKMTLSSAAAVSGAAISPTRITYLLLQIVMTVLNLRLGQWLPNPAKRRDLVMPTFVPFLRLLAMQRSGGTLQQSLMFVTDGGHYDNLGIDVLLDRRCRLIIASDAGADPEYVYADLANLFAIARRKGIRLVQFDAASPDADEGITLESVQDCFKQGEHACLWKVIYPEKDDEDKNICGLCVYLKSSVPAPQPFDAGQYKLVHKDFPHDTTANQFFHEAQFEAYRALGYRLAQNMLTRLRFDAKKQDDKPINARKLLKGGVFPT